MNPQYSNLPVSYLHVHILPDASNTIPDYLTGPALHFIRHPKTIWSRFQRLKNRTDHLCTTWNYVLTLVLFNVIIAESSCSSSFSSPTAHVLSVTLSLIRSHTQTWTFNSFSWWENANDANAATHSMAKRYLVAIHCGQMAPSSITITPLPLQFIVRLFWNDATTTARFNPICLNSCFSPPFPLPFTGSAQAPKLFSTHQISSSPFPTVKATTAKL